MFPALFYLVNFVDRPHGEVATGNDAQDNHHEHDVVSGAVTGRAMDAGNDPMHEQGLGSDRGCGRRGQHEMVLPWVG